MSELAKEAKELRDEWSGLSDTDMSGDQICKVEGWIVQFFVDNADELVAALEAHAALAAKDAEIARLRADVERMREALFDAKDCINEMRMRLLDFPLGKMASQRVPRRCDHVTSRIAAALAPSADKQGEQTNAPPL